MLPLWPPLTFKHFGRMPYPRRASGYRRSISEVDRAAEKWAFVPRREVNRINVPLTRLLGSSALQACFQDAMSLGKTESIRITKDTFSPKFTISRLRPHRCRCSGTSARRQQWTTRTQPGRFSTSSASAFHRSAVFSSTRLLCGSFVFAANSAHSDALARYSSVNVGILAQVLLERRDHGASRSIASGSR